MSVPHDLVPKKKNVKKLDILYCKMHERNEQRDRRSILLHLLVNEINQKILPWLYGV